MCCRVAASEKCMLARVRQRSRKMLVCPVTLSPGQNYNWVKFNKYDMVSRQQVFISLCFRELIVRTTKQQLGLLSSKLHTLICLHNENKTFRTQQTIDFCYDNSCSKSLSKKINHKTGVIVMGFSFLFFNIMYLVYPNYVWIYYMFYHIISWFHNS